MTAMDRLTNTWKVDLYHKMGILPGCSCVSTIVWLHHLDFNEIPEEKARWERNKYTVCCFEQILEAAPHKKAAAAGKVKTNS